MALNPTDRLLLAWLAVPTTIALTRPPVETAATAMLLAAHGLLVLLVWLFARLDQSTPQQFGRVLRDFYPLILLPFLYAELGILNDRLALETILAHDHVVQAWEQAVFGEQVSFTWIRRAPSLFWSEILHGAYLFYYPIIFGGPPLLLLRATRQDARDAIFAMMLTFVLCYTVYLMWPVAGPSYAFPQPDGPVVETVMARLLYAGLASGSSVGAAFPSSHVAATIAVTIAIWRVWPALGWTFALPAVLLTVGTVYTQMHYAVDAIIGVAIGVVVPFMAPSVAGWLQVLPPRRASAPSRETR